MLYVTWKMDVLKSAHAGYKESFSLIRYKRPSGSVQEETDLQMPIIMQQYTFNIKNLPTGEEKCYRGCRGKLWRENSPCDSLTIKLVK